jgi:hypothetical protein
VILPPIPTTRFFLPLVLSLLLSILAPSFVSSFISVYIISRPSFCSKSLLMILYSSLLLFSFNSYFLDYTKLLFVFVLLSYTECTYFMHCFEYCAHRRLSPQLLRQLFPFPLLSSPLPFSSPLPLSSSLLFFSDLI